MAPVCTTVIRDTDLRRKYSGGDTCNAHFSAKWGPVSGFIAATAVYSLVHVGSCNFMLVMAALVAGGFWGLAYRFRPDRLGALVVSHAVWDAAVFVWFPI